MAHDVDEGAAMTTDMRSRRQAGLRTTGVRYEVLAFACTLSMITYIDGVCFGRPRRA